MAEVSGLGGMGPVQSTRPLSFGQMQQKSHKVTDIAQPKIPFQRPTQPFEATTQPIGTTIPFPIFHSHH